MVRLHSKLIRIAGLRICEVYATAPAGASGSAPLWFSELARVLVCLDHVASRIVNANYAIMGAAAVLRVIDCRARVLIPQPTEWQRIRNQIDAALIFARANFVNVHFSLSRLNTCLSEIS